MLQAVIHFSAPFQLTDPTKGYLNPLEGTITVQIDWIYNHLLAPESAHSINMLNDRQYHQIRWAVYERYQNHDYFEYFIKFNQL